MITLVDLLAEDGVTLHGSGANRSARCPFHKDDSPSLSVNVDEGVYLCHGCGVKGNARTYLVEKRGLDEFEASDYLKRDGAPAPAKPTKSKKKVFADLPRARIATHYYHDADGKVVLAVCRYGPKAKAKCTQHRPVEGGWVAEGLGRTTKHPLYRLTQLQKAVSDQQVMVVEGEKCADTVAKHYTRGVVTTWLGGSNAKLDRIDWSPLHGRRILLVADTDKPGRKVMEQIAALLRPKSKNIRLVLPPGDTGEDIHDWLETGGKTLAAKRIGELVQAHDPEPVPPPTPPPAPDNMPPDGWISGISKRGLQEALHQLGINIRWNVRASIMEIERDGAWVRSDDLEQDSLRELIAERCRIAMARGEKPALFGRESWDRSRNAILRDLQVDPFIEWVESLPEWDGEERLDLLIHALWGVESEEQDELAKWASRYPLLGAIQRAYNPGDKLDEFPILVGAQGAGKSVFLKHLLPDRCPWFGDGVNLANDVKLFIEQIQGLAIAEVGEMAGLRKADIEIVKATVARTVDVVRLSYRRDPAHLPRRAVFVGTANPGGAIVPNDQSGNRRFVPIDLAASRCLVGRPELFLDEHRTQLWSEALRRYRNGQRANLPDELGELAFQAADAHRSGNEQLEEVITDLEVRFMNQQPTMMDLIDSVRTFDSDLAGELRSKAGQMELARFLQGHGWRRKRSKKGRYWAPPRR